VAGSAAEVGSGVLPSQGLTFGFSSNVFWDWVVPWKLVVENYVEKWTMNFESGPAIVNEA
jgi:hypothetical protein